MISHKDLIQNKYLKLYLTIINYRIKTPVDIMTYTENHHILPDSMGGTKTKSNMVRLYPREHFIVHKLLVKCTSGQSHYKMCKAIAMFSSNKKRNLKFTSRDYLSMSIARSIATSKQFKDKKQSPEFIKRRCAALIGKKHTPESVEKMKISKTGKKNTPEHNKSISLGKIGKKQTLEHINKRIISHTGLKRSEEFCKNQSIRQTGKKHTPEACKNMSLGKIGLKYMITKVSCQHCGLLGSTSNITKYHNANCKYHPDKIYELLKHVEQKYSIVAGKLKLEIIKIKSIMIFQQITYILLAIKSP